MYVIGLKFNFLNIGTGVQIFFIFLGLSFCHVLIIGCLGILNLYEILIGFLDCFIIICSKTEFFLVSLQLLFLLILRSHFRISRLLFRQILLHLLLL